MRKMHKQLGRMQEMLAHQQAEQEQRVASATSEAARQAAMAAEAIAAEERTAASLDRALQQLQQQQTLLTMTEEELDIRCSEIEALKVRALAASSCLTPCRSRDFSLTRLMLLSPWPPCLTGQPKGARGGTRDGGPSGGIGAADGAHRA